MFNAMLTTALEVIILLDILGAIVYCIVSGIVRARKQSALPRAVPVSSVTPFPAGTPAYTVYPQMAYASPVPAASESRTGWFGWRGIRNRFSRGSAADPPPADDGIETGQRRIGMILDSFKEDV